VFQEVWKCFEAEVWMGDGVLFGEVVENHSEQEEDLN